MEDSGAILSHISSLKEMLDQVNEEIEAHIQITREIENSIVKCEEMESHFETKEAELIRTSGVLQFEGKVQATVEVKEAVTFFKLDQDIVGSWVWEAGKARLHKQLFILVLINSSSFSWNKSHNSYTKFTNLIHAFERKG